MSDEKNIEETLAPIYHVPMLVDNSINPSIIPGVCKTIEKFYLTYKLRDVIDSINKQYNKQLGNSSLRIKGDILKLEQVSPEKQEEFDRRAKAYSTGLKNKDKDKDDNKKFNITNLKIDDPSPSSISLEPTWMKIQTDQQIRMIGIKVIPYSIVSNISLSRLITDESNYGLIHSIFTSKIRKFMTNILGFYRSVKKRIGFGDQSLTGDVRYDVLWGGYGSPTFLMLNIRELEGLSFKQSNVKKLMKMGWGSFIIADDIESRAIFCMQVFNGLCSILSYQFIYSSIKEGLPIYKDLSEVKKSVSPIFRMKGSSSKILGECKSKFKSSIYKKLTEG